jgi:S-DNA-T family DNA segregation ATPase FtsK/SpoIIIE
MARAKRANSAISPRDLDEVEALSLPAGVGELFGVVLLAIAVLLLGGLASYQFGDGSLMGPVGRFAAGALYAGFGMAGYLVVLGIVGTGVKALTGHSMELRLGEGLGFSAATVAGCVLLHVTFPEYRIHGYTAGGLVGELLGEIGLGLFDHAGTYLVALAAMLVGLVASTPLEFRHLYIAGRWVGGGSAALGSWALGTLAEAWARARERGPISQDDVDAGEDVSEEDDTWDEADAEAEEDEDAGEDESEADSDLVDETEDAADEDAPTAKPTRTSKGRVALAAAASMAPRANRRRVAVADAPGEGDGEAEAPDARARPSKGPATPEVAAKPVLPEIVISEPAAALGDDAGSDTTSAHGKKKPPLRVEALREGQLAAEGKVVVPVRPTAPAANGAGKAARKSGVCAPVQYLTNHYELPSMALFEVAEHKKREIDKDLIYEQSQRIETTLAQFKVRGKVVQVHPGPVITRYEFKPDPGVKVSTIETLEKDLAMALEAVSIRILAPIPGKATVGFEVPNRDREKVVIQEILAAKGFSDGKMLMPIGLGKSITGQPECFDLAKAPHLLVAGATGSGKSVGVNTMICSLLFSCSPDDVRMIFIDPKKLELSVYKDIPHLLLPVITEPEKACTALKWAVGEMERRYTTLEKVGVRDIVGFNAKLPQLQAEWEAEKAMLEREAAANALEVAEDGEEALPGSALSGVTFDKHGQGEIVLAGATLPERPEKMPFIVIVIDEFADLMATAGKDVEANVARLAAKARAAGLHIVLATQRPSVDVITGTIKNNFPTRIGFQVTSDVDSRTILDQKGAKQLLGNGDMLFMERGLSPRRVQGCFVSEHEIERVVDFIRKQARPSYNLEITEDAGGDDGSGGAGDRPSDELYDKAVRLVCDTGRASTSWIQRQLGIGYNRAARLVEEMEKQGVVGPIKNAKGERDIYAGSY